MGEFAQNVLAGAQIANMRFDKDVRMQELRLKEAEQRMHERQIAATAQMYLQHAQLYQAEAAQKQQDDNILKAAGDRFHTLWSAGMTTEDALKESLLPVAFASPTAFQKVAAGISTLDRADASNRPFTPSITTLKGSGGESVDVLQTGPRSAVQVKPVESPFNPSITPATDSSGNKIDILRTGPKSAVQVRPPSATGDTTAMKDISKANELLDRATTLESQGDVEGARRLRDDAELLKSSHAKGGMTFESDGQGGFRLTQGATPKVPMGAAVKVAERLSQTEKAIDNLDDLASTLRPQDVGFKGVLGELFLDKVLPQFGTPTSDVKRMDNRTKLRTLAENLIRQVSADSRFSNADRESISKVLPSAGAVESFEHTQQVISTLRKIFAKRALIDAKEVGQPPPAFALRTLDDEGLVEAAEKGLITKDQAASAYRSRHATP